MVGKVQWCHVCWPQRGPSWVVLCQCSCPSAMLRLCQGKESMCLAFFLHLCSHGLLGGGTECPQFSCKRNVWCSTGGRGWRGEGWWVQNVFTHALLITTQEKPVALVFALCSGSSLSSSWNCYLLGFFIGKTRLRWGMSRAQPFCQTPRAQHTSYCSRVRKRDAGTLSSLSLSIVSGGILCPAGFQLPTTALLVLRQHLLLVTPCLHER